MLDTVCTGFSLSYHTLYVTASRLAGLKSLDLPTSFSPDILGVSAFYPAHTNAG